MIATTNNGKAIDPAFLRPGRLERIIDIPLPMRTHESHPGVSSSPRIHRRHRSILQFHRGLVRRGYRKTRPGRAPSRATGRKAGGDGKRHSRRHATRGKAHRRRALPTGRSRGRPRHRGVFPQA
ncbi:hypothetical protein F2981_21805 (plasmid) [Sinorhizobium meliloti]|nr:hypothetical protein [Sinorhizobium meliloti]